MKNETYYRWHLVVVSIGYEGELRRLPREAAKDALDLGVAKQSYYGIVLDDDADIVRVTLQ